MISTMAAVALTVTASSVGFAADVPSPMPVAVPDVLVLTPSQAEGPFYPVELPADRDADLTVVDGAEVPAAGEPLTVEGELLTTDGAPVEGAVVEIWQTDHQGVYLHPRDPGIAVRDEAFQGYGESVTDTLGAWAFRTILPEIYGGRPRHIHAKVKVAGETVLTTQIYFSGGDISQVGAVALDEATAPMVVEVVRRPQLDGSDVLHAQHLLVIPPFSDG
jgi:protocatechuate 3,4-dioxygenase beta subunit